MFLIKPYSWLFTKLCGVHSSLMCSFLCGPVQCWLVLVSSTVGGPSTSGALSPSCLCCSLSVPWPSTPDNLTSNCAWTFYGLCRWGIVSCVDVKRLTSHYHNALIESAVEMLTLFIWLSGITKAIYSFSFSSYLISSICHIMYPGLFKNQLWNKHSML